MTDLRSRAVRILRNLADRVEHRWVTLEQFRRNPQPGKYWIYCDTVTLHRYDEMPTRMYGMNVPRELLGEEVDRRTIPDGFQGMVDFGDVPRPGYYQGAAWAKGELGFVFDTMKMGPRFPHYSVGPFPVEVTVTR